MTKKVVHLNNVSAQTKAYAVEDIAKNFGLKGRIYQLFNFYALHCSNGFTPSESFIERETGITKGNVSHVRKSLGDMHLIGITDDAITLDWEQLVDLARIEPYMLGNKQSTRRQGIKDPKRHHEYVSLPNEWKAMYLMHKDECDAELKERGSSKDWFDLCYEAKDERLPIAYGDALYKSASHPEVTQRLLDGVILPTNDELPF